MSKTDVEDKLESALYFQKTLLKHRTQMHDLMNKVLKELNEFDKLWEDSSRTLNQYRLLNDIRIGKIIPIVADTGKIAEVSFS